MAGTAETFEKKILALNSSSTVAKVRETEQDITTIEETPKITSTEQLISNDVTQQFQTLDASDANGLIDCLKKQQDVIASKQPKEYINWDLCSNEPYFTLFTTIREYLKKARREFNTYTRKEIEEPIDTKDRSKGLIKKKTFEKYRLLAKLKEKILTFNDPKFTQILIETDRDIFSLLTSLQYASEHYERAINTYNSIVVKYRGLTEGLNNDDLHNIRTRKNSFSELMAAIVKDNQDSNMYQIIEANIDISQVREFITSINNSVDRMFNRLDQAIDPKTDEAILQTLIDENETAKDRIEAIHKTIGGSIQTTIANDLLLTYFNVVERTNNLIRTSIDNRMSANRLEASQATIIGLETQIATLTTQRDTISRQLEEATTQLNQERTQNTTLQQELDTNQERITDLEQQLRQLTDQAEQDQIQMDYLRQQSQQEIDDIARRLAQTEEDMGNAMLERDNLQTQVIANDDATRRLQEQIDALLLSDREKDDRIGELANEGRDATDLQRQLDEANGRLADCVDRVGDLEIRLEAAGKVSSDLKTERKNLNDQIADLRQQIIDVRPQQIIDVRPQEIDVRRLQRELDKHKRASDRNVANIKRITDERDALRQQHDANVVELREAVDRVAELTRMLEDVIRERDDALREIARLREEIDTNQTAFNDQTRGLLQRLTVLEDGVPEIERQCEEREQELRTSLQRALDQIRDSGPQITQLNAKIGRLTQERDQLQDTVENLRLSNNGLSDASSELTNAIDNRDQQIANLLEQIDILDQQIDALTTQNNNTIDALRTELDRSNTDRDNYLNEATAHEATIQDLLQAVNTSTAQVDAYQTLLNNLGNIRIKNIVDLKKEISDLTTESQRQLDLAIQQRDEAMKLEAVSRKEANTFAAAANRFQTELAQANGDLNARDTEINALQELITQQTEALERVEAELTEMNALRDQLTECQTNLTSVQAELADTSAALDDIFNRFAEANNKSTEQQSQIDVLQKRREELEMIIATQNDLIADLTKDKGTIKTDPDYQRFLDLIKNIDSMSQTKKIDKLIELVNNIKPGSIDLTTIKQIEQLTQNKLPPVVNQAKWNMAVSAMGVGNPNIRNSVLKQIYEYMNKVKQHPQLEVIFNRAMLTTTLTPYDNALIQQYVAIGFDMSAAYSIIFFFAVLRSLMAVHPNIAPYLASV